MRRRIRISALQIAFLASTLILTGSPVAGQTPGADDCAADGDAGDVSGDAAILFPPQVCHGTLHTVDFLDKHDWYKVVVPPLSADVRLDGELCVLSEDGRIILQFFFNPLARELLLLGPENLIQLEFVGPGCITFSDELEGLDTVLGGAWYPFLHGAGTPTQYRLTVA